MGKIKVTPCDIKGLYVIEPTVFKDERGYFMETYNQNDFHEAGLDMVFVQDNQSMSVKGVLRGLHYQKQYPQGVLIVEALAQVGAVAILSEEGNKGRTAYFGAINNAKFKKKVVPGDKLKLECHIIKRKGPVGIGSATATVDGKLAVSAELTFMIG